METWSVVDKDYLFSFDKTGALLEKRVLQSYDVLGMIGRGVMLAANNVFDWDGEPLTAHPLAPLWTFIEHSVRAEELSIVAGASNGESMALVVQADDAALVVLRVAEHVHREGSAVQRQEGALTERAPRGHGAWWRRGPGGRPYAGRWRCSGFAKRDLSDGCGGRMCAMNRDLPCRWPDREREGYHGGRR
jgi:hypothetical protein